MKWIKYKFLATRVNHGTEEAPEWEDVVIKKEVGWNEINEAVAKREAYNGEYAIVDDGAPDYTAAPGNILAGEYVTVDGVLYLATENIPNGEPIIPGQNATATTIEQQLYAMKGE